jgi:Domain of unknown function (DUF4331)
MKRKAIVAAALVVAAGALAATLALTRGPDPSQAASHREAPLISQDATADSTDMYAFISPDKPDTVTLIADYVPFEEPSAGPNWYSFSTTARYDINIDNTGDAKPDLTYRWTFKDTGSSFGPLGCVASPCQTYTLQLIKGKSAQTLGANLPVAPNNIGPATIPNYSSVWSSTIKGISGGQVFAGPADDPFFGDIGAAFDSVTIRYGTGQQGGGKDAFAGFNVHALALQVPIAAVKGEGDIIGVWTAASRPVVVVKGKKVKTVWRQVSRLGNPLVNELLIATPSKDGWNATYPANDAQYDNFLLTPILAPVINQLYKLQIPTTDRTDLKAIFHQGLPGLNQFGSVSSDMIRLNLTIPPAANPSRLTVAADDTQGWPNGRRLLDDVIDLAENGLEGAFFTPKYQPVVLGDGVNNNDVPYQTTFPYVAQPNQGFADSHGVVVNPQQPLTP